MCTFDRDLAPTQVKPGATEPGSSFQHAADFYFVTDSEDDSSWFDDEDVNPCPSMTSREALLRKETHEVLVRSFSVSF